MIIALKAIMDSKGISAQELSEITGISKIAIWNYASGRNKPDPETLCTIADALDVSLDMLVRGKEKDHSEEWSKKQALSRLESYSLEELQDMLAIYAVIADRKARGQSSGQGSSETI